MTPALSALLLFLALAPAATFAAGKDPLSSPSEAVARAVARAESDNGPRTLRFFNRDIVTLRTASLGYQPAQRAAAGAQRIREALAKNGPGVVRIAEGAEGLTVTIDGHFAFRILEGDLDADDGETFAEARKVVSGRLEEAIGASRQAGRGEVLVRAIGLGALATLVLGSIIWAILRIRFLIRRRIDISLRRRWHLAADERAGLLRMIHAVGQIIFVVLLAVIVEEWLRFVLAQFPYTRPWSDHLTGYVVGIVSQVSSAIVDAVPGLGMVAVIA